jgi:hypothetical protein
VQLAVHRQAEAVTHRQTAFRNDRLCSCYEISLGGLRRCDPFDAVWDAVVVLAADQGTGARW